MVAKELSRTSAETRSGYVAAKRIAIDPPAEWATNATCSAPAASITAFMSSIQRSRLGSSSKGTGSDMPVPLLSKRMSRLNEARRARKRTLCGSSHCHST
jgi:hypothetical protein